MNEHAVKNVTFDRTLEIIRIILELRSQIPKSAPNADIYAIIASLQKCGLFWSRSDFTTNNTVIIRIIIIEFVNGVLQNWVGLCCWRFSSWTHTYAVNRGDFGQICTIFINIFIMMNCFT